MTDRTMHIGELAERVGLSLRSLRHWDEVGLVPPSGRTDGGFRLYTEADEARVRVLMRMKPLRFTLEEMSELARALDASPADPLAAMPADRAAWFRVEALARRERVARDLADADATVALLGGGS
ncbi:MerR family transcriptional regulator [Agrococcus sp. SL85]|uniref:MerR family transcriptional regulator n=1 Tax=Agrococcus sp. SL85 TaxID=2995141 RepID=UPI00226C7CB6|nr:MerR family transcriptional regulator [Agrococcus sp. SL85]WAC66033.1 MerR family transcriptional regulator [Agrococcus sp. SL85]